MGSKEYIKIDTALRRLETYKYPIHTIEWCADRIDWAWRWRKITHEEMQELCDRVCNFLEQEAF